jgi:hypothetical protein
MSYSISNYEKKMKIIVDYDDFFAERKNNSMDWLIELKDRYPNFVVTLFTIWGRWHNKKILYDLNQFDWIEFAAHGYYHYTNDEVVKWNKQRWFEAMNEFEEAKIFQKIFKAPNWMMSELGYQVLKELDWAVAIRKEQIKDIPVGMKYYCFEDAPNKVHGHTWLLNTHQEEGMFSTWDQKTEFDFVSNNLIIK